MVRLKKLEQLGQAVLSTQAALTSSQQREGDTIFLLCLALSALLLLLWSFYFLAAKRGFPLSARTRAYTVLICLSWSLTSVCLHVLNKAVVVRTQAPATVAAVQMAIAVAVMAPVATLDIFRVRPKQLACWLVVPLIFSAVICTSSFTYEFISLSLYAILRNLAPLVVMPLERLIMEEGKAPAMTTTVFVALLIMAFGAMLYVGGLHGFSWVGVAFAMANVLFSVVDRFTQRRLLTEECRDMPARLCALINNAVGIAPCLVVSQLTHELQDATVTHRAVWTHPHNVFLLLLSGIAGLAICYLGFECQRLISVTSFFVVQNLSRVLLIVVGVVLFGDPLRSPVPVLGLVLSGLGSCLYGNVQMRAAQEKRQAEEVAAFSPKARLARKL